MNNKISKIIQWSNGMVMVYGENGKQMSEYQGKRKEVIKKLEGLDFTEVEFFIGSWNIGVLPVNKEQFFSEAWS